MKMNHLLGLTALVAGTSLAAAAGSTEAVTAAAKKLAAQSNYSWTTTVKVPEDARWKPGPTHGKTEKGGAIVVESTFGDNTIQSVIQGEKGATTNRDGEWQSLAELENSEGPGRFRAMMLRNISSPADQALELVAGVKELKMEDGAYAGALTEKAAKTLISFRRRNNDGEGPTISGAKGSVKFWIKDGELIKYQFSVEGSMEFNGNDIAVDRTTTVEIQDVGKTKVVIPSGAKSKLS